MLSSLAIRHAQVGALGVRTPCSELTLQCCGDRLKRQHELERIVEQAQRTEALIPFCGPIVLRVDCERDAANFSSDGERPFTGRQQQITAQALTLHRDRHRKTTETKSRHFVSTEPFRQRRWGLRERNGARADRVVPKKNRWCRRSNGDEGFRTAALVVLSRIALQILVQRSDAAIEISPVVTARQRLLAPVARAAHRRFRRRFAAVRNAAVGFGGCSRRFKTRALSRADSVMRSCRATISSAAGRALRITKLVRSRRS